MAIGVVPDAFILETLAICKVISIGKMRGSSRAMPHMAWARQGMEEPLGARTLQGTLERRVACIVERNEVGKLKPWVGFSKYILSMEVERPG